MPDTDMPLPNCVPVNGICLFLKEYMPVVGNEEKTWTLYLIRKTGDKSDVEGYAEILHEMIADPEKPTLFNIITAIHKHGANTVFTGNIPIEGFIGFGDRIEDHDCDDAPYIWYRNINQPMVDALMSAGILTVDLAPLR